MSGCAIYSTGLLSLSTRCPCGETLQEGDDVCKKLWGLPINFLLPSPLWSLYCNVQPPVRAGTAHCSVLMLQGDPKRLSQVFFSDKPKKIKKCNNPMLFKELLLGGFGILMFQKCHVCGNLPFGAFPINAICFAIQGLSNHIHP